MVPNTADSVLLRAVSAAFALQKKTSQVKSLDRLKGAWEAVAERAVVESKSSSYQTYTGMKIDQLKFFYEGQTKCTKDNDNILLGYLLLKGVWSTNCYLELVRPDCWRIKVVIGWRYC